MINLFFVVHDYSGARTYANELLGWLSAQKGIIVHKVYWESRVYREFTALDRNGLFEIHLPYIERNGNSLEKYSSRCMEILVPLISNMQNVVMHLNSDTQVYLGAEAKKRFGVYIIYTLHFLPNYFSYFANGSAIPDDLVTSGDELKKLILKKSDHVICVTSFAKESIIKWYKVNEKKITTIYNGIGSSLLSKDLNAKLKERLRRELGFCESEKIILFVGRLQRGKGIKHLLSVFEKVEKKISNLRLVIVGDGDFSEVFNHSKGAKGKITVTGKIPGCEIGKYYKMADIGVIPSVFEQCSYVALEMMQSGLPVVVASTPGLNELYMESNIGLLVPVISNNNQLLELEIIEPELEKAIVKLLDDDEMRKQFGAIAIINWKKKYTVAKMGEETMKIYEFTKK